MMSNQPPPQQAPHGSGHNQSLLELIYAVKGLAQSVEYMHSDLRRLVEEEGRDREREIHTLREVVAKNAQALAILPIQISDRFENLLRRYEKGVDGKVDNLMHEVEQSLTELRNKLTQYVNIHEKEKLVEDAVREVTGQHRAQKEEDVTGRIELTKQGDVMLQGKFSWQKFTKAVKVAKWVIVALAAGGGVAGCIQLVRSFLGG